MTEKDLLNAVQVLAAGYEKLTGKKVIHLSLSGEQAGMSFEDKEGLLRSRAYKI